jgi:hypothetical protein
MVESDGNIWDAYEDGKWIVISTNIGWKKDGSNPMGAGISAAVSRICKELPLWYGKRCMKYKSNTAVCLYRKARLILFPTKPLNIDKPWMSWKSDSNLSLIRRSSIQLRKISEILSEREKYDGEIVLPMVGCHNGNLSFSDVKPILEEYLDDRFVLFRHHRLTNRDDGATSI